MMLAVLMLVHNGGRRLELGLRQLQTVQQAGALLVLADTGSQDGSLEKLRVFAAGPGRGAVLLQLDQPELGLPEAVALVRGETGADYVLGLTGQDLLLPKALPPLLEMLRCRRPELAVCGQGWWQTGPGAPLAAPDAGRMGKVAPKQLMPDPRRLLPAAGLAGRMGAPAPLPGPLGDWQAYDAWLQAAASVRVFPGPVLLRPPPPGRLAQMCSGLAQALRAAPRRQRPALLELGLLRLGDEIALCNPASAAEDATAAAGLQRSLGWRAGARAARQPGLAGQLMRALQQGGEAAALAVLAQQAAVQERARMAALTGEIRTLREDLDLALPGPDYLRDLYERVRLA